MILTQEGKEIVAIYKQNGDEVDEVKDANGRLVYTNTREITGTLPLSFTSRGKPLTDYRISGNTVQDGTPTPDVPVDVVGCGVRTRNLLPLNLTRYEKACTPDRGIIDHVGGATYLLPIKANTTYAVKIYSEEPVLVLRVGLYNEDTPIVGTFVASLQQIVNSSNPEAIVANSNYKYLCIQIVGSYINQYGLSQVMINEGSTALPYEPYGYKLPISSGGGNLFDYKTAYAPYLSGDDIFISPNQMVDNKQYFKESEVGKTITISVFAKEVTSTRVFISARVGNNDIVSNSVYKGNSGTLTVTVTPTSTSDFFNLSYGSGGQKNTFNCFMLNLGSTALPYEPYVEPTETNIYLGEVESTRRIKKLVLTGEEGWAITSNGVLRIGLSGQLRPSTPLCTHYLGSNSTAWQNVPDKSVTVSISGYLAILDTTYTAIADFKSYLAAQYAAGTPVTVWYALATPETTVVNEPLMKIGNYADTITMAQAGVTIPTVSGTNVLDMPSPVKPSEVYIKGKGIKSIT